MIAKLVRRHSRALIWTLFGLGSVIWHLPLGAVSIVAVLMLAGVISLRKWGVLRQLAPAYVFFALLWAGGRVGFGLYNGMEFNQAVWLGCDLVLRVSVIAASGASLLLLLSPYEIAREVGLSLRKVSPNHYWKLSLALLVMLSFIHTAMLSWQTLRQTIQMRAGKLHVYERIRLTGWAMLRLLSRQTWERALCIAGRNLDRPEAWD